MKERTNAYLDVNLRFWVLRKEIVSWSFRMLSCNTRVCRSTSAAISFRSSALSIDKLNFATTKDEFRNYRIRLSFHRGLTSVWKCTKACVNFSSNLWILTEEMWEIESKNIQSLLIYLLGLQGWFLRDLSPLEP